MYLRSARNKASYFDSLSTVSEQKRRVINASLCICCLVWTDPSPPWMVQCIHIASHIPRMTSDT